MKHRNAFTSRITSSTHFHFSTMIKHTLLITLGTLGLVGATQAATKVTTPPALIPVPAQVKTSTAPAFQLNRQSIIIHDRKLINEATLLAEQLRVSTGFPIATVSEASVTPAQMKQPYIRIDLKKLAPIPDHGYQFSSSSRGIQIIAKDAAGIFYGTRTLLQLFPAEVVSTTQQTIPWTVPATQIIDAPRFQWRGMHLDESRHFFGKAFVKRYIDLLANHKMNVFHWHLIDDGGWRIEIKKYPKLTETGAWRSQIGYNTQQLEFPKNTTPSTPTDELYGGFYTQEDIKEIVAYAKARHVRIIPEIEIPGHSLPALDAYPELRCSGELKDDGEGWTPKRQNSYCAGKDASYQFLEDVLTEVFTLFPDEYVHIGGDEVIKTFWEQCPDCAKRMKKEKLNNANELQSYLIRRIEQFLNKNHKKLIGWDEITHGGLTPNATVMFWIGMGAVPATVEKGHDIIMTPMTPCYFDYGYPSNETSKVYQWEVVPEKFLGSPFEKKFLGAQGNVWTEGMETPERVEFMVLPRMLAMSEILWSPRKLRNFSQFSQRLNGYYPRLDVWGLNYRLPSPTPASNAYLFKKKAKVAFLPAPKGFTLHYTTNGSQPTTSSETYKAPLTVTQNTKIRAILAREGKTGPETTVECVLYRPTSNLSLQPGMDAEYAEGQWKSMPNFRTLDNVVRSKVKGPDLSIRKRDDYFACRYTGFIKIKKAGLHHFALASDDGSILKLGGATVINHDGPHGYSKKSGSILLEAGTYPIEISFLELTGAERLDVFITTPGKQEIKLPNNLLFRNKNAKAPRALKIHTSIPNVKNSPIELAVDGDDSTYFHSSRRPQKDETVTVRLKKAINNTNITVLTGKPDGEDSLNSGVLEAKTSNNHWKPIATFFGGKAEATIKSKTQAIRIRMTANQGNWLAIREIKIGDQPRTMFTIEKQVTVSGKKIDLALTVDIQGCEDLKPRVQEMTKLYFINWPKIAQLINAPVERTPKHLFLSFKKSMGFPAYVSGTRMVIEGDHLRRNPEDTFGVFTHELTHFVQSYPPGTPGWFSEGTADYVRFKFLPDSKWAKIVSTHTDKSKPLGAYWSSSAFLIWIEKNYSPKAVETVSRLSREGKYSDDIWKKLTGKTLESLTEEYKKS